MYKIFHPISSLRALNLFGLNEPALYKLCTHYVKNKKPVECSLLKHHVKGHSYTFDDKVQCKDNLCDSGKKRTTQSAAKEISYGENVMALEVGNWVELVVCCASGLCGLVHSSRSPSFLNQLCSDRKEQEEGTHSDIPVSNALWHPSNRAIPKSVPDPISLSLPP